MKKPKILLNNLITNYCRVEDSIDKLLERQVGEYVGFSLDYEQKSLRIFINARYEMFWDYVPEELLDDVFLTKVIKTVILDYDNGTHHLTNKDRAGKFNESPPREMMGG